MKMLNTDNNKPMYSIIIPTFNRANCIWKAINSVKAQTFIDWEIIVVDGYGKDRTRELVNEYRDPRIIYIFNENDIGASSARNAGIRNAKADYIAYLDSDDWVYENWLEEMHRHVKSNPEKSIFMPNKNYKVQMVDETNKILKVFVETVLFEKPLDAEQIKNLEVQCDTNGLIHKKSLIEEIGFWDDELKLYEDFDFLLRAIDHNPQVLHFVPLVLVNYTRTYGKDGLCGKAKYSDLVKYLSMVFEKHKSSGILDGVKWYPILVEKFKEQAKKEDETGEGILEHLLKKYEKGN